MAYRHRATLPEGSAQRSGASPNTGAAQSPRERRNNAGAWRTPMPGPLPGRRWTSRQRGSDEGSARSAFGMCSCDAGDPLSPRAGRGDANDRHWASMSFPTRAQPSVRRLRKLACAARSGNPGAMHPALDSRFRGNDSRARRAHAAPEFNVRDLSPSAGALVSFRHPRPHEGASGSGSESADGERRLRPGST
jgi:hypothetical protein